MINIQNKVDCCGCNACGDVCAHKAITFKSDNEGFWYPEVDMEKCINCGLCEKVCPIINVKDLKKNDYQEPICYAAEHKNIEVVFDSTSGGLFSALAEIMYRSKGYVGGAIFNEDFSVRHYISNDKEDLPKLRSSKYLQSNLEGFYTEVKRLVIAGEQVLVCGTPCQMAALRAYLRKDYDNLIIADFICRGINSPKVWRKYLDSFKDRYGSPVVYAKAKSKEYGWRNLTQKVILADGRHMYETVKNNNFTKGYLSTNAFCRPSCYDCKFKGFPRMADITLADFWGIQKIDKSWDKNLGTSLVMINSRKGETFFERAKNRAHVKQLDISGIMESNPALVQSLPPSKVDRTRFFEDLDKMTFVELSAKYLAPSKMSWKGKLYHGVRSFLHIFKLPKQEISLWETLKYSTVKQVMEGKYLAIYKYCTVQISKKANLIINDCFSIGKKRIKGSKLESRLLIEDGATLEAQGKFTVIYGADIELFKGAKLLIRGGGGTNINFTCICADYIEIGENVMIGRNVTIRDNNGHHFINLAGYKDTRPVIIGNKVWLCEGCTIMPGVKIGDGAIVGANSLVTQNVPAHSIVSGSPAKVVEKDVLWKY